MCVDAWNVVVMYSETCRRSVRLDEEMRQLHEQLLMSNEKLQQLEMDKSSMDIELRCIEAQNWDRQRHSQTLNKDIDYAKERETALQVDRSHAICLSVCLSVCLSAGLVQINTGLMYLP